MASEKTRYTWREVQNLNIVEFLNTLAYMRDKNAYDKEQIKKYKRR